MWSRCGSAAGSQIGPDGAVREAAGWIALLAYSRRAAMLSRSSFARVTSDQHQSGAGSTTGQVRRLVGQMGEISDVADGILAGPVRFIGAIRRR